MLPAHSATRPGLKYRPEIDGLRALAILPVVLFHYKVAGFAGGFVGVDVFFVISGFLITSLIVDEMNQGQFSIVRFYERRIRRIFPALFVMLAAATVAAYFLLFPADLIRYARSLLATAGFASNFEFWQEAGYFDVASDQKPLLHLWSIAVEEQFYLLFPAFLLVLGRRARTAGVLGLLLLSFGFSQWAAGHAKEAAFYLLPSRAWELMLGAVLATGIVPKAGSAVVREFLALGGLLLVAVSVLALNSDMPFPGMIALLPCGGAALLIHATADGKTFTGRVLSQRPLVFIGLVSYSLYLWHWPVYVFVRYVLFRELSPGETAALIAASFLLAVLSWRFVEQPFRRPIARRKLFPAAAAVMASAFVAGAFAASTNGLPQRLPVRLQQILAEQDDSEPRIDKCFPMTALDVEAGRLCAIGAAAAKPSFVLWGDSHADAIVPPIDEIARHAQRAGYLAGGASCAPLVGVTTWSASCRPFNDAVEKIALRPEITDVILEARWAKYADGATYGDEPRGHVVLRDDQLVGPAPPDNHAVFVRGLERTIQTLMRAGKRVVIVASVPEVGWPVPAMMARKTLAHDTSNMDVDVETYMRRQRFVFVTLARMHQIYGVAVVYPHRALCGKKACAVALNGIPLYRDEHHLSVFGALRLESLLKGIL
ncbi:MAG: acyltransferase family protein [Rhizomicrobium sp.]|jgi:peptidoglycan/LPS O-acetylase OafA/YrhL